MEKENVRVCLGKFENDIPNENYIITEDNNTEIYEIISYCKQCKDG